MPVPASELLHAALVLSLELSSAPRTEGELALITEQTPETIRSILNALRGEGRVHRAGNGWTAPSLDAEIRARCAEQLRHAIPEGRLAYCLPLLVAEAYLEDCERGLAWLDTQIRVQSPGSLLCLERIFGYLHEVALRRGNERFGPLIAIFACYLQQFMEQDLPKSLTGFAAEADESSCIVDEEMHDRRPLFMGILHYLRGEFTAVLSCYEHKKDVYDWKYQRFDTLLTSCASQSAFCLRRYNSSFGINESSRRAAALAGDAMLSRFWMLHLAFVLLRKGDFEAALPLFDCLFTTAASQKYNKTEAGAVRGLALYHFLQGRSQAAYHLLRSHTERNLRCGVGHVPFEEPLLLDMLWTFEEQGFAPVPCYGLDETLDNIIRRGNRQLRGAACRMAALRLRRHGHQLSGRTGPFCCSSSALPCTPN